MVLSWQTIGSLLKDFGLPLVALLAVVYAFLTERVVPGGAYARMRTERDAALALLQQQGERNERDLADIRSRLEGIRSGDTRRRA